LFALELIGAYFVRALTTSLLNNESQIVQNQAQLLATIAAPVLSLQAKKPTTEFSSILTSFPNTLGGEVYILDTQGTVLDTSTSSALIGQKRTDSVATRTLLSEKRSMAVRYDVSQHQHLLAIAVPITNGRQFLGIVEYVVDIQSTYATVRQVTTIFYTGSALVLLLTAILGIVLSRTFTQPVLDVTAQARTMANGNFSGRVKVRSDDELGELATAINHLTEKLEEALAANVREQEKLNSVIQYMGDAVFVFDSKFTLTRFNDAAKRLVHGLQSVERLAETLSLPSRISSTQDACSFITALDNHVVHIHLTTIRGQSAIDGYVAVMRDVTEQEQLNRARRDFVANVSHELRTPLTSIKTYIEALQDSTPDEETQTSFLGVISQETDRMVRLTQDLLQLSGLEQKRSEFHEVTVNVGELLHDVAVALELQAKAQSIDLKLNMSPESYVSGDKDLLHRLLDNILTNAFKYTPSGGTVYLHNGEDDGHVLIVIRDTGIGIPEEDIPHVFERFYRVDKARSRRKGGSGLGLALAREIAERHGGSIRVESQLDHGTQVTVVLPKAEEAPS